MSSVKHPLLSGCLHLHFGEEAQLGRRHKQSAQAQLFSKLNRCLILILGAHLINLDANYDHADEFKLSAREPEMQNAARLDILQKSGSRKRKKFCRSKWSCNLKHKWISKVVHYLTLVACAYLIVVIYYQYAYDFNLLRACKLFKHKIALPTLEATNQLTILQDKSDDNVFPNLNSNHQINNLLDQLRKTEKTAKLLNTNYWHLAIFSESVYLSTVIFMLNIYLITYVNFNYYNPFDFWFYRDLLDSEREYSSELRLIRQQVAEFVASSRTYFESFKNRSWSARRQEHLQVDDGLATQQQQQHHLKPVLLNATTMSLEGTRQQFDTDKMLHDMLANGSLTPLNKSSLWNERRQLIQFMAHIWLTIDCILFDLVLYCGLFLQARDSNKLLTPAIVASLLVELTNHVVIIFCAPAYLIAGLDQIRYVNKLRSLISCCICLNERELSDFEVARKLMLQVDIDNQVDVFIEKAEVFSVRSSRSASARSHNFMTDDNSDYQMEYNESFRKDCELRHRMNANYLFVLMHYKIFVAQFKPIKRSLGLVFMQIFIVLFTVPVVTRLNLNYATQVSQNAVSYKRIQIGSITLSCLIVILSCCVVVPICYLYSRCQDLYRALWSLMAHLTDVRRRQEGAFEVYDLHATSQLGKELANPERLLHRFITESVFGLRGSYTSFVRALFWWGVIMLSIALFDGTSMSSDTDSISTLLRDPFGVF